MFLVKDIMTTNVVTVKPTTSIKTVSSKMASNRISSVIVVDHKKTVGIISERDFVKKVLSKGKKLDSLTAADVMSSPILSVKPNTPIAKTVKLMKSNKVRHFVVKDENLLLGILTETDLMRGESEYLKSQQILQNLVLTLAMTLVLIFLILVRLV